MVTKEDLADYINEMKKIIEDSRKILSRGIELSPRNKMKVLKNIEIQDNLLLELEKIFLEKYEKN
ncbi:hypothetical protein KKA13_03190 [Patescibacteria group bacterium]|nr:hypothetical protein [Patescibacteria group bacterium]